MERFSSLWSYIQTVFYLMLHKVFGTSITHVFEKWYQDPKRPIPWAIGGPQPVVVDAAKQGILSGKVLDVGTGLGHNAIALAEMGMRVTAIDLSDAAVERAREEASKAEPHVTNNLTFKQADLLDPASLRAALGSEEQFDSVLDSAVFHCFTDAQQEAYAANISAYVKPGGKLFIFVFSDKNAARLIGPRHVFREAKGWRVESLEDKQYKVRPTNLVNLAHAEAVAAVVTKT